MARTNIDPDVLRSLARSYLSVARTHDMAKLTSEQQIEGRTVKIIIERDYITDDDGSATVTRDDEHVTVKVGSPSRQETVIAAPAR